MKSYDNLYLRTQPAAGILESLAHPTTTISHKINPLLLKVSPFEVHFKKDIY